VLAASQGSLSPQGFQCGAALIFQRSCQLSPEQYDIKTFAQESLDLSLTYYSDNDATTVVNLTGYTASFRVMDKPNGTVIATLTSGSGITLGGSAGTVTVSRTPAQVQDWKIDTGAYDLVITSGSGKADLLLHGSIEVVKT